MSVASVLASEAVLDELIVEVRLLPEDDFLRLVAGIIKLRLPDLDDRCADPAQKRPSNEAAADFKDD